MTIAVTTEHEELAASVRAWCDAHVDGPLRRGTPGAATDGAASVEATNATDGTGPGLPAPVWRSLVEQGLTGIHVPEADGGEGFGPVELAVVLEQLGRALVPGSFFPTVLASSLLARSEAVAPKALGRLAAGGTGAVGLRPGGLRLESHGEDALVLSGRGEVLGGADAEVLLLPAVTDGHTAWVVVEGGEIERSTLASLDVTRPVAEVVADDLRLPADRVLDLDEDLVHEVAVALAAAEAAGIADWCLATATAYAKTREQFGRPIGQFQGTKHRCAEILVDVERIRAVAWDAARALDDDEARGLAADAAAVIGLEAAVRCAEEAIQVLGGIGYTWEHDAHLYLRRAVSLRALVGGDLDGWRRRSARGALAGRRRELRLELDADGADDPVREEVRRETRAAAGLDGQARRDRLVDAGLVAPHWPPPFGRGADAREQLIIDEELAAAGLNRPILAIGSWAAPTIIAHGTDEQQERFIRPTLTGEIFWCQLFSEPEAGSDLAALRTRAERVAPGAGRGEVAPGAGHGTASGGWVLTGQKVWTSLAQIANWGICLARTDPDAPKHRGITYFLVDMASDGIEIRPIQDITGAEDFNEVILDGVFVPDELVVGEVDDGWSLARTTLANERVGLSDTSTWGSDVGGVLDQVLASRQLDGEAVVPAEGADGPAETTIGSNPDLERHLGQLVCEGQTLRLLGFRITLRHLSGTDPGPTANVRKLVSMQHSRDVAEAGLRLLGPDAAVAVDAGARWGREYLAARAYTIGGGTTEVLRNQIAERLLGLPRDP